jgi:hypothetical protein
MTDDYCFTNILHKGELRGKSPELEICSLFDASLLWWNLGSIQDFAGVATYVAPKPEGAPQDRAILFLTGEAILGFIIKI